MSVQIALRNLGYRKRSYNLKPAKQIQIMDLNWSGGTRSIYTAFTLDGKRLGDSAAHNQVFNPVSEGQIVPIPEGCMVIVTGSFCGKESTASVYYNGKLKS